MSANDKDYDYNNSVESAVGESAVGESADTGDYEYYVVYQ